MIDLNRKIDDFGKLVMQVEKEEQLFESSLDFFDLTKENNIDVSCKISFLGEYQRLLIESFHLLFSMVLTRKIKNQNQ